MEAPGVVFVGGRIGLLGRECGFGDGMVLSPGLA